MPVATTTEAGRQVLTPAAEKILNDREQRRQAARAGHGVAPISAGDAATEINQLFPEKVGRAPLEALPEPHAAPKEKHATIRIEVAPDGLHITAEYTGTLASIPAAIERLKAAGVLDLVQTAAPAPKAPTPARAERVDPSYNAAGDACCPVHRRKLSEGDYGLFCSAKAKDGQVADKKGYCGMKFND